MSLGHIFESVVTAVGVAFVVSNAVVVFRLWRRYG
jgi:hypothetical protein